MPRPTDNPYGQRALRLEQPPMKGLDVWELQIKLIGWGSGTDNDGVGLANDPVRVNGTFDATTQDAVMRFQKGHGLAVDGVVGAAVFGAIDLEVAHHVVPVHELKCACSRGGNAGPILCRCGDHDLNKQEGVCQGFGKQRFAGKFLLDKAKLAHGEALKAEKLDLYEMQEHDGVDKALLWALRAVLHRSGAQLGNDFAPADVLAGYRCWLDNYHHTDDTRWQHRRSTFHLGKAAQIKVAGALDEIREAALLKCGFQLRWQEPDRVGVAEWTAGARPPVTPDSLRVDTVRRLGREPDDFVKTDHAGAAPCFADAVYDISLPMDLDRAGLDPLAAPSAPLFSNAEAKASGCFPLGGARGWHGGVHLFAARDQQLRAITAGQVVGCRVGEAEQEKAYGSRNFVLLRHQLGGDGDWKGKVFYSLYMHLDQATAAANAAVPWRKQLFISSKRHVLALAASPLYKKAKRVPADAKDSLIPCKGGLARGQRVQVTGGEVDPATLDLQTACPGDSRVVKLTAPANTYIFTRREGQVMGRLVAKDDALAAKITAGDVIGLKHPIPVAAGEVIGAPGNAATHATLAGHGPFCHLETFAEAELPCSENPVGRADQSFVKIDVADKNLLADRKAAVTALADQGLLPELPGGVIKAAELKAVIAADHQGPLLRNVVLHGHSAWALDWKQALQQAASFGHLADDARDALGDAFNEYRWWAGVAADEGQLPAAKKVYHYHPIALCLQLAYRQ